MQYVPLKDGLEMMLRNSIKDVGPIVGTGRHTLVKRSEAKTSNYSSTEPADPKMGLEGTIGWRHLYQKAG